MSQVEARAVNEQGLLTETPAVVEVEHQPMFVAIALAGRIVTIHDVEVARSE